MKKKSLYHCIYSLSFINLVFISVLLKYYVSYDGTCDVNESTSISMRYKRNAGEETDGKNECICDSENMKVSAKGGKGKMKNSKPKKGEKDNELKSQKKEKKELNKK